MAGRWSARISDGNSGTTPLGAAGAVSPEFRAASFAFAPDDSLSLTINKPTGVVQDDVMVAVVSFLSNTLGITAPAGWTLIDSVVTSGATDSATSSTYSKRAGAAEPADYTWTTTEAREPWVGAIAAYDNVVIAGAPVNASSGAFEAALVTDTTVTAPSAANVTAGSLLIGFFIHTDSGKTFTPPAGMTERVDQQNANGFSFSVADQVFGAGGDSGQRVATMSAGSSVGQTNIGQLVALTPAAAGGGPTFFGVAEDVLDYSALRITAESDRFGFLDVEFSTDGANWRKTDSFPTVRTIFDPVGETSRSEVIPIKGRFARVNFRNRQAAAQTFFRLQTILLPEADQALSRTPERFRVHNGIATVDAGATGTVLTITGENAERAVEVIAYGATQSPGSSTFTFQQVLLRANTAMHRRAVRNQVGDHWVHVRFDTSGNDIKVDVTNDDVISHSFIGFVQVREF